jgi:hypothetical protein
MNLEERILLVISLVLVGALALFSALIQLSLVSR